MLNFLRFYRENDDRHAATEFTAFIKDSIFIYFSIHVMIHSFDVQKESVIEIEAGWKNMALTLDEPPRNIKVSPQEPATFLIYHSDREDYSRKDRFRLDVDSIGGHNDEICMIVSVYNKECPLHNKPGNVKVFMGHFLKVP